MKIYVWNHLKSVKGGQCIVYANSLEEALFCIAIRSEYQHLHTECISKHPIVFHKPVSFIIPGKPKPISVSKKEWKKWIEIVFWPISGCLKHGLHLLPELHNLDYELLDALTYERSHSIGGDDLHAIREQIWFEFDIPSIYEKLWPTIPKVRIE